MSTIFSLVNPKEREYIQYLWDHLEEVQKSAGEAIIEQINNAPQYNGSEEIKEEILDRLKKAINAYKLIPDIKEIEVGVSTFGAFHWRTNNGFSSIKDLKDFMDKHPELKLYSEYWEEYTLEEFAKREGF